MRTVTLSVKVFSNSQLKLVDKFLKSALKGLEVVTKVHKVYPRGWVQTTISGEDEKVALHYLAEQFGLCPKLPEDEEKLSIAKGYVTCFNKKALYVDVGIFSPMSIDVAIPTKHLQAQLVDGRKMALEKITKLFGFVENLPLTVKVCSINKESNYIEATLSEKQLNLYRNWTKSLLDRLIVLGASYNRVRLALKRTRCDRYVVNVEPLGLFEHAIACKLGTDAAGLIPKVGKNLWSASLSVFSPKETMQFFNWFSVS